MGSLSITGVRMQEVTTVFFLFYFVTGFKLCLFFMSPHGAAFTRCLHEGAALGE